MAVNKFFAKDPSSEAALAALREVMKKGKSKEQCACIDYLVRPIDPFKKKGCLQKKGCCGKGSVMTMDEYIQHVQDLVNRLNLKQRAIEKIGLDESQINEIPPVLITAFEFDGEGVYVQQEEGDIKGTFRSVSNKYKVTWIFFSNTQIYTYTYTLDTISDDRFELTRDFFYTDVTCIRTAHTVKEKIITRRDKGCRGCLKKPQYIHANIEWDTLQIVVPSDDYAFTCVTDDSIEQSIQAAKAMIREKKQA